jgi:hypothetical protein
MKILIILSLTFLTVLLSCCYDKAKEEEKIVQSMAKIIAEGIIESQKDHFKDDITHCDKMVLKLWDLGQDSSITMSFNNLLWKDSITDIKRISKFGKLFKNDYPGGYCCCPTAHYTILFYKDNKEIGEYGLDTSNNSTLFYDLSYQASHSIKLTDWNSFIRNK